MHRNGDLFEKSKHVGYKHYVLLTHVQSTEIGDCILEGASVVLENGLTFYAHILANDLTAGFFVAARGRVPQTFNAHILNYQLM